MLKNDDKAKGEEILRERERAAKGFKPPEGGDPLAKRHNPLDLDDEAKEEKEARKESAKGFKPREGGDPLDEADANEEKVAESALPIGLGIIRSG